jgi:hypothetical protein
LAVEESWAKQPYHAAEGSPLKEGRAVVKRGIEAAKRGALREVKAAVKQAGKAGNDIVGCALLVGEPMPDWSVEEILAVHFRMHKAEGVLFRDALAEAIRACKLKLVAVPEKTLTETAAAALKTPATQLGKKLAALGKQLGPPWTKDQKDATLAAMIALG